MLLRNLLPGHRDKQNMCDNCPSFEKEGLVLSSSKRTARKSRSTLDIQEITHPCFVYPLRMLRGQLKTLIFCVNYLSEQIFKLPRSIPVFKFNCSEEVETSLQEQEHKSKFKDVFAQF
jgi:hypothetical protein